MSSANVYLRMRKGQTIDDISEGVLEDCVQLVKANSIQGNKVNNIDVVYTPWQNLKKTPAMDVGQVSFHNNKAVRTVRVEKRINEVVNRLNRTKVERKPDLKAERESVNAAERAERKLQLRDKEKIMRVPYGSDHEFFRHSLFLVFCNRITTSAVSAVFLLALKYVSFPVQTLAKCAKMIPVMIWGTIIMQKKFKGPDYFLAVLVTLGCSLFILFPGASELGRESTV